MSFIYLFFIFSLLKIYQRKNIMLVPVNYLQQNLSMKKYIYDKSNNINKKCK